MDFLYRFTWIFYIDLHGFFLYNFKWILYIERFTWIFYIDYIDLRRFTWFYMDSYSFTGSTVSNTTFNLYQFNCLEIPRGLSRTQTQTLAILSLIPLSTKQSSIIKLFIS